MRYILAILILTTVSCTNLDQSRAPSRAEWMQHYDEKFILQELEKDSMRIDSLGKIVPK